MPSKRKQINVRVDEATETLIAQLQPAVTAAIGLDVSLSDLIRLGMQELARKYLPAGDPPSAPDKPKGKRGK